MKKNILYALELVILMTIFFISGHLFSLTNESVKTPYSIFELQEKYSQKAQDKLQDFLSVLAGPGNVKTNVHLSLKNVHRTITKHEKTNNGRITTTDTTSGVMLESQHISVIINQLTPIHLKSYQSLIQEGMGLDFNKGDSLSIQLLPFYKVPFLTFGFTYLTLIRLAGVFLILFFILIIVLATLYLKEKSAPSETFTPFSTPSPSTEWNLIQNLTSPQLRTLLQYVNKNTLAQLLQIAPFMIHKKFMQEISTPTWKQILLLSQQMPFSVSNSLKAKEKIETILQKLKNQKVI